VQNFKYAFRFIGQCFKLARENEDLQKPWMYLSLGHLNLLVIWLIPLVLVVGLIDLRPIGMLLIGLICVLVLISMLVWGELTSLGTCQAFDSISGQSDRYIEEDHEPASFITHWLDILLLVLSIPGLYLIAAVQGVFSNLNQQTLAWLDAQPLIQPILIIENRTLREGFERAKAIFHDNALRIRPGFIRVRWIANLVQWFLVAVGIVGAFLIGLRFADPMTSSRRSRVIGAMVGLFTAGGLTSLGIAFSTFVRACYHTALYQWVRLTEKARHEKTDELVTTPDILEKAISRSFSNKKER